MMSCSEPKAHWYFSRRSTISRCNCLSPAQIRAHNKKLHLHVIGLSGFSGWQLIEFHASCQAPTFFSNYLLMKGTSFAFLTQLNIVGKQGSKENAIKDYPSGQMGARCAQHADWLTTNMNRSIGFSFHRGGCAATGKRLECHLCLFRLVWFAHRRLVLDDVIERGFKGDTKSLACACSSI